MSDTDDQLDTNDVELENQEQDAEDIVEESEEIEEEQPQSLRDELAKQLQSLESEDEDEEDVEEVSEEDSEEDYEDGDIESLIDEDLKSTFKYLRKEDKATLEGKKYPKEIVNMVLRDLKEKNTAFQEKTKDFSEIVKTIEPYEQALAMQGISPSEKIRQYIAIENDIMSDPVNGILRLAQSYGVDLTEALKKEQSNEGFVDPALKEISDLRKQIDELKSAKENDSRQSLQEQVNQFQNATNEDGSLSHPHFEKVRPLMAAKFKNGEADSLDTAYEMVVKELGLSNNTMQKTTPKQRKSVKEAKQLGSGVRSKSTAEKLAIDQKERKDEMLETWKSLQKSTRKMA